MFDSLRRVVSHSVMVKGSRLFGSMRATRRLLKRFSLSQDRSVGPPRAKVMLSVWGLIASFVGAAPLPTHLVVVRMGRFGNAYQQVFNAIRLSHFVGIRHIVMEPVEWLRLPLVLPSGLTIESTHRLDSPVSPTPRAVLWGRFFWRQEFAGVKSLPAVEPDISELWKSLTVDVGPSFGDDHLVIHLRGGDVFSPKKVPGSYGQPPLAFYESILSLKTWHRVTIVHEDQSNPVLGGLSRVLSERGIEMTRTSGKLVDDVAVLLSAQHFVLSSGTFGRAIVDLSPHVKSAYVFDRSILPPVGNPRVNLFAVRDRCGEYVRQVMSNNWAHTDAQIQLMVQYPESCVECEPLTGSADREGHLL